MDTLEFSLVLWKGQIALVIHIKSRDLLVVPMFIGITMWENKSCSDKLSYPDLERKSESDCKCIFKIVFRLVSEGVVIKNSFKHLWKIASLLAYTCLFVSLFCFLVILGNFISTKETNSHRIHFLSWWQKQLKNAGLCSKISEHWRKAGGGRVSIASNIGK